jgi:histidinol-phosphate aminotransferase
MYHVSASVNDIEVVKIPLTDSFQIDLEKAVTLFSDKNLKLIFICSPNNPTANSMNYSEVEYIISKFNGIVVVDEAYIDFSEKASFIKLVNTYPNLILMQTFSKALGLAAIRVGMAFTNPSIVQYFNKLKPPYNISTINQKAALLKLSQIEQNKSLVFRIKKERDRLSANLLKMKIVEKVYPSDANFLLVKLKNANYIYNELVSRNIIIRNRSNMIDNCVRITIGKKSENDRLINALKSISI